MSFKLVNVLITFQFYINKSLFKLLNNFIIIYLNNILIYSKSLKQYKKHIYIILKQL